jgi:hypothetical protein
VARTLVVLAAVCIVTGSLKAQDLDEAAVARALKAGTDNRFGSWTAECRAEASREERRAANGLIRRTGSYDVILATSFGAVALLAHQAKEEGKTLVIADVPAWALKPALHVFVEPRKPPRDWGASSRKIPIVEVPSSIEGIILNSGTAPVSSASTQALETADASFTESKWLVSQLPTRVGPDGRPKPMVFERSRARATFAADSVHALPAGDLQLVVITKDGERQCGIRGKDRVRLFPSP